MKKLILKTGLLAIVLFTISIFVFSSVAYAMVKPDEQANTQAGGQPQIGPPDSQMLQIGPDGKVQRQDAKGIDKKDTPNYAPDRLIIKLKANTDTANNIKARVSAKGIVPPQSGNTSIDNLHSKFKVKQQRQLFRGRPNKKVQDRMMTKQAQSGSTQTARPDLSNTYLLEVEPGQDIKGICEEYKKDLNIEYAEPDYIATVQAYPATLPNDTYVDPDQNNTYSTGAWGQSYEDMWGLKKIQADKAWAITQGAGVVVAVVDTGIDYNHEDIAANVWQNTDEIAGNNIDDDNNGYVDDTKGYDFTTCAAYSIFGCAVPKPIDSDPLDGQGHGTHVAGTIAAVGNNSKGIIGVAPQAKVMAVKGLNDSGSGSHSDLANALHYAADNGAKVINNSWGGGGFSQTIEDAVNYAHSLGCIVVAAAGNNNSDASSFTPANCTNVVTVAASNVSDFGCSFSNYGIKVDVAAPGGNSNILSLLAANSVFATNSEYAPYKVGTKYIRLQGTSMATPHVSGLAALLVAKYSNEMNEEIRGRIDATTDQILQYNPYLGTGRINAYKALTTNPQPYITLQDVDLQEEEGDGDGVPEAGEKIKVIINLKNVWLSAVSVSGTISTISPYVSNISTPSSNFGNIALGDIKDNVSNPFVFQVSSTIIGYDLPVYFSLITNSDGIVNSFNFNIVLGIRKITMSHFNPFVGISSGVAMDISGNKIVWTDVGNGIGNTFFPAILDVYLYDLATNTEKQITTNSFWQASPAISGDKIVYRDNRNGNLDVYLYDLATNTERQITTNSANQYSPEISGDKIVYGDDRNGNQDVYLYDLATNTERQITTNSTDQFYIEVSGNKIVYSDNRNGNWDIFLYNLDTNQERQITTTINDQFNPVISGNKIVWADNPHNGVISDICFYDLSTNQEIRLTSNSADQAYQKISGNKIIWADWRSGKPELYMADLNKTPTINPIGNKSVNEGINLQFTVSATDADGDTLTYSASGLPSGVIINPTTGVFSWTPSYAQSGTYQAVFTASDGSATARQTVSITVINIVDNTLPAVPFVTDSGVYSSSTLSASWFSSDPETGIAEYQYSIGTSLGATNTLGWTSAGTATSVNRAGLSLSNNTIYYFNVKAKNGVGLWSAYGVSNGVKVDLYLPSTPIVTDSGSSTHSQTTLSASWTASTDAESGIVEYQYKITQDSTAGAIIRDWTTIGLNTSVTTTGLNLVYSKKYYFSVKAKNGAGMWSTVSYSDGIDVVNNPPVLTTPGIVFVQPGTTLQFTISGSDPDGDTLIYTAQNLPSGATFNAGTRLFNWAVPSTWPLGEAGVGFMVSDGRGGITPAAISIYICTATKVATATSARSSWWNVLGTTLYATGGNPSLEYDITIPATKYYYTGLAAKNISGNLPAGYSFNITLYVDGVNKGSFSFLGNVNEYRIGSRSINLAAGTHRIKFVWTNDYYEAGKYDANIQIKDAFVQ